MCEIKLKKCPRCDKEKPETREFFYWIGKLNRYENKCKICHINKINKPKDEIHFSENGIKFKKCTECGIEKEETSEFFQWGKDKCKYATQCRRCLNDKANKRSRDHRRKKNGYVAPEVKFSENGIILKKCNNCGEEKEDTKEFWCWNTAKNKLETQCRTCISKKEREREKKKRDLLKLQNPDKYSENGIKLKKCTGECEEEKEETIEFFHYRTNRNMFHSKCRKCVNEIANKADKKRTEINPAYKFMDSISKCIHEMLKSQKSIDNKTSCRKYVPFTKGQLIKHFEELFLHPDNLLLNGNPWMTFQNRGNYRKDFSEEDPSTWTWHIDHIVPQAKLKFDSYDHPNFLKCWSLENLRPLRADLNMKKGDRISY